MKKLLLLLLSVSFIYSCGSDTLTKDELKTELKEKCSKNFESPDIQAKCESKVDSFIEQCKDYDSEAAYDLKEKLPEFEECVKKLDPNEKDKFKKCGANFIASKAVKTCSNFFSIAKELLPAEEDNQSK